MLVDYLRKFYDTDSPSGKNGKDIEEEHSGKTDVEVELDEEFLQIEKDVEESRKTILNEDSDDPGSKTPEEKPGLTGKEDDKTKGDNKPLPDELEITEDFINQETFADELKFDKLDPDFRKEALLSLKGKKVDKEILKNIVHTQVTLQEYKAGNIQTEDNLLDGNLAEKVLKTELDIEGLSEDEIKDVNSARAQALYTRLRPKYKDITLEDLEDKASINSYISSMNINNPLDADDFKSDFRKENHEIVTAVNEYKDVSKNWPTIMRKDATEMIGKYEKHLGKKEMKIADLGKTLDENYVIKNILQDEKGQLKPELVTFYKNNPKIPILNKDKFYQALNDHFDEEVTSLVAKRGVDSFINNKDKKKPNPSISETTIPGTEKVAVKTVIADDEVDFDEMDKILEGNRSKILKADGSSY